MTIQSDDDDSRAVAKNHDGRVSLAQIEGAIAHAFFTRGGRVLADQVATSADLTGNEQLDEVSFLTVRQNMKLLRHLNGMTICVLVMTNGFIVIGKSAPMDPDNFDEALGQKFAREDAIRQLWPLMAFSRLDRATS